MKKITTLSVMLMLTIFMAACGSVTTATDKTPSGTATAMTSETPSGMGTGTPGNTSLTGNVDELIAMVTDYVTSGEITGQAELGLLAKLTTIQQKVMNGQTEAAANEMGAFVNEVQAQVGKKISEPAATALIAKAQQVAAEIIAGVPVTGGQGTVVPTASTLDTSKPAPLGDQLEHQAQWDLIAQQVVQSVGLNTFDYDLYQLPANSAWDDTLAYYETEAAAAGWGDAPSQTNEMANGHYAAWSKTGSDGTTNYFIVAQVDTPEGTFTLNIIGNQ
jgi:FIMAH domain-containing protein